MERRELVIDETADHFGIDAISLVSDPAIERDFYHFSQQKPMLFADEDKQILVGPALIPNKDIYRRDEDGAEYNVFFSTDTVRQAAYLFNQSGFKFTLDHESETSDVILLETWIVEDKNKDKQRVYGFKEEPGTWFVALKVEDKDVWRKVKEGDYKGFSIEGYFADKLIENQKEMSVLQQILNRLDRLDFAKGEEVEKVELMAEATLEDGTKIATDADEFAPGVTVVVIDEEGNASPAPAGEHKTSDGYTLVVGEEGVLESYDMGEEKEEEMEQTTNIDEIVSRVKAEIGEALGVELSKTVEENGEALTKAVEQFTSQLSTLNDRLTALEKAPATEHKTKEPNQKAGSIRAIVKTL